MRTSLWPTGPALALIIGALPTPALGAGAAVVPPDLTQFTLDNGLDVVLMPVDTPGIVSVQTWMDVGARDEVAKGSTGFAHFFEHLMFHGTERFPAELRGQRLVELGVEENAWTSEDNTCYHLVVPAPGLAEVLEMEADRFGGLTLQDEEVRREAGAVYGEFRKAQASADWRMWLELRALAFQTHTYHHPVIGIEADIQAMPDGMDRALAFFATHYQPTKATLVISGDLDVAETRGLVARSFGNWQADPQALPAEPWLEEPPQEAERRAHIDWELGPTNPRLSVGWRVPAFVPGQADGAALTVLNELLSSKAGPLHRRLVETESLAWGMYAPAPESRSPGLLQLHIELREGVDPNAALAVVDEELAALRANPKLSKQVDLTGERLRRSAILALSAAEDWGYALGFYAGFGGDARHLNDHLDALQAVDADDVHRVMDQFIQPTGRTVITLAPAVPPEPAPETDGGAP